MAERVGFDPLNSEAWTALHGLIRTLETKYLSGFQFPPNLDDMFWMLIYAEDVAQQWEM